MELFECLEYLKLSRERRDHPSLLRESASPFVGERDGLTRERERKRESESVCYLVLLPTSSGTRWFVGAHNTVDG